MHSLPLRTHIAWHKGRPTLMLNDAPQLPMLYALTDCPGGRWTWEEVPAWNIRNFTNQGIRLFHVSIWLEQMWQEDGTFSIELARKQIRGLVDICPNAAVFFRLHINSPMWWNRRYPQECTRFANGSTEEETMPGLRRIIDRDLERVSRHSMASLKWKSDTTEIIKRFCEELSATPEGDYLAGIHMASGVFHEWHYWGFIENEPDTSLPMTVYFRKWLQDKYGTDESLQAAWKSDRVTFANAEVPDMRLRLQTTDGIFRNPVIERHACDYYECHQQSVSDNVIYFCGIAKEFWPRPIVTGAFYGYFFCMFGRQATGGHLQMEKVLNSPNIDYLSAPQAYSPNHREMGGSGQSRGIIESCYLHGKLILDEMDTGTFLDVVRKQELARVNATLEESLTILRRNMAESFTRAMGLWFYDFGPTNNSGWWDHPILLTEIQKINRLFSQYYEREFVPQADVLFVYDTNVFYYLANNRFSDPITDSIVVNKTSGDAYHSGAALDFIYLCDLQRVELDRYRVVVFANTYYLTSDQKRFIKETVAQKNRHLVWMCAPGYTDGDTNQLEFVADVTGFGLKPLDVEVPLSVQLNLAALNTPASSQEQLDVISDQDGSNQTMKEVPPYKPVFRINDKDAESLGFFADTDIVALGKKTNAAYTSWFCSLPLQNPVVMRHIFSSAGAHIYNEDGDVIYSGGGILVIHTARGGERTVTLRNGLVVQLSLDAKSTSYIDNRTGEVLLLA